MDFRLWAQTIGLLIVLIPSAHADTNTDIGKWREAIDGAMTALAAGDLDKGITLAEQSLDFARSVQPEPGELTKQSLLLIALLYQKHSNNEMALSYGQQAADLAEKIHSPENADRALICNLLGELDYGKRDYVHAETQLQRAIAIREKIGPDSLDLATSLSNLGIVYDGQGQYAKAEPLLQRALTIREKALAPDHFVVALSLFNLGMLHQRQGLSTKALEELNRALTIGQKSRGADDPLVKRIQASRDAVRGGSGYMGTLISLLILVGVCVWVYKDATRLQAAANDHTDGLSATAWTVGTFLLALVVVPAYLIRRHYYKRDHGLYGVVKQPI